MYHTNATALTRAADRRAFVNDMLSAVEAVPGAKLTRLSWLNADGSGAAKTGTKRCALEFAVPGKLSVMLTVAAGDEVPLLHWYGAERALQGVYGAWAGCDVNRFHRRKATSYPVTLNRAIDAVVKGLTAAADGSAFAGEAGE